MEDRIIKCLLIDESSQERKRLEKLLKHIENVEIVGSMGSSNKTISLIEKHIPDIVFLEIEMTEATGFEIMKSLKSTHINTEVVFVTSSEHYAIKAINNGAFGYLVKPVNVFELREIVTRYKTSDKSFTNS